MFSIIFEVSTTVFAVIVFGWAIIQHCKSPRIRLPQLSEESNVVSIHTGKQSRLEKNLQEFIDAENALACNEHEKYMALRMQALENAKRNLSYRNVAVKRVS